MVGFLSSRTGQSLPLELTSDGDTIERLLPARVLVGGAEASVSAARLGFGLIQAPRQRLADELAAGTLVEVLASSPHPPTPLSILYPTRRQLSPRVSVLAPYVRPTS